MMPFASRSKLLAKKIDGSGLICRSKQRALIIYVEL